MALLRLLASEFRFVHDEVNFGNRANELDLLGGVLIGHPFEVLDERLLAGGDLVVAAGAGWFLLDEASESMDRSVQHLVAEFHTLRAGRATPAMLEGVRVEYYGSMTPLNQMANVSAPQTDLITIQPWDRSSLGAIERAIASRWSGSWPTSTGAWW